MPDLSFGALLRRWRVIRHLSQLDLALDAEISTRHLSCVETGREMLYGTGRCHERAAQFAQGQIRRAVERHDDVPFFGPTFPAGVPGRTSGPRFGQGKSE